MFHMPVSCSFFIAYVMPAYLGTALTNQNFTREERAATECLVSFNVESFVFEFVTQKYKD
jgi:hypothetical protein